MKDFKSKILSFVLLVAMLVSCVMPLASCVTPEPCSHADENGDYTCDKCGEELDRPGPGDEPKNETYTVIVESAGGMRLEGVMVYLHDADSDDPYATLGRARTDKNGVATFTKTNDKSYNVELEGVPTGYKVNERYPFDTTYTSYIKLVSSPISPDEEDFKELEDDFYYELGDIIHDFSITDLNGKTYTVSDVLKESQLLVLNFWFVTCSPCLSEFPYLSEAYNKYNSMYGNDGKNIVEVFAINDHNDPKNQLNSFAKNPVTTAGEPYEAFKFPVFKAEDSGYTTSDFVRKAFDDPSAAGYPTTLFIDRYGAICCIEVGPLVNTKYWTNAFDHFTADDYKQKLVGSAEEFTVAEKPNIDMPTSDMISESLTGNYLDTDTKIEVSYRGEDDEYSWPFITDTFGGVSCVKPSNYDKDNSYAILYADVSLKKGEALAFDYFASTQRERDYLYVIVDGKDIYSISGVSDYDDGDNPIWQTCCTYVAQADGVYELALVYQKDIADYSGDDTVYIKDLRIIDQSEIDVETYIFRYAAFNPTADNSEFNNYANVFLNPNDGYYHVDSVDGPLLLANLLEYTKFDAGKTVFERAYLNVDDNGNFVFMVDGVNKFLQFEKYGTHASNSKMYGLTPVNEELKSYLEIYTETYRRNVGKKANENLWLSLCCYYDAYGTNGKQLENPVAGLSTQAAYKIPATDVDVEVTYNSILIPRGYLFEFIPTESGVYRFTTNSITSVIGWLYNGSDYDWGECGDRILHASSDTRTERICPTLTKYGYSIVCPECEETITIFKSYDENGEEILPTIIKSHNAEYAADPCPDITDLSGLEEIRVRDYRNVSIAAYLEAGVPYYFAPAYHTVEEFGSFTFKVTYEAPSFDLFIQASPGPFTFELEGNGEFGSTIAGGIKPILCDDPACEDCIAMALLQGDAEGTKYYHATNPDGSKGYILFADLYQHTDIFTTQSVVDIARLGGFDEYTDVANKYIAKMLDEKDHPERQGCVAITEELAEALQYVMDKYTFENVEEAWIKFCFYYLHLGPTIKE